MLYYIIIFIVLIQFLFQLTMIVLNAKASKLPIPEQLSDIYDAEQYRKQQAYSHENRRVGFLSTSVDTMLTLCLFAFGGFALIDTWVRGFVTDSAIVCVLFMYAITLLTTVFEIPFSVYSTFWIEQRHGFNRTTPKLFVQDQIKGLLLSMLFTGLILGALVKIYEYIPEWFWLLAWGVVALFTLCMQLLYSDLIVPLFNKQKPLDEGELRTAIEDFAAKAKFNLKDIYVVDSSKRSTKANAYFTGFGPRKRIVLYDTLIEQLTTEEIVAVLSHEIGHYKHRHVLKGTVRGLLQMLITLYVFGLVIDSPLIAEAAGCSQPSFHINLIVFSFIYSGINMLVYPLENVMSRHDEWQADEFAKVHGLGTALISALKKMSQHSLSNLTPHPVVVFFEYSHPTLLQRVMHMEGE